MKKSFFITLLCLAALVFTGFSIYDHVQKARYNEMYESGVEAYEAGDYTLAEKRFLTLIEYGPADKASYDKAHLYLAHMASAAGSGDKMITYWSMILTDYEDPSVRAEALLELAKAHSLRNEMDRSRQYLDMLVYDSEGNQYQDNAKYLLAKNAVASGDIAGARNKLKEIIEQHPDTELMGEILKLLGDLNIELLMSPVKTSDSDVYEVRYGDALTKIADSHGITLELLMRCNGLDEKSVIKPGQTLKLPDTSFTILIDKSKNTLTVFNKGAFFKQYSVGTGQRNSTPVGDFKITEKLKEPKWYKPGGGVAEYGAPDNLLGSRWLGINYPGYGIHGTWDDSSIGKQSSAGCIRLVNRDVEELFDIIPPGTPVTIVD